LFVQVTGSAGALRNGAPFKGWDLPPAIGLRRKVTLCSLTRIMSRPGLGTPDLRRQHDGRYLCSDRLICIVQYVLVVREEQHLSFLRQFAKDLKARSRTVIIEINEQIVRNKGQRRPVVQKILNRGDAKREIELIGGARAQPGDGHRSPVSADAREMHFVVLVKLKL
jgi:hypothetical protein